MYFYQLRLYTNNLNVGTIEIFGLRVSTFSNPVLCVYYVRYGAIGRRSTKILNSSDNIANKLFDIYEIRFTDDGVFSVCQRKCYSTDCREKNLSTK